MIIMHKDELIAAGLKSLTLGIVSIVDCLEDAIAEAETGNHKVLVVEPLHYPGTVKALATSIPVVVLTSSVEDEDVLNAIKAGASAYLHTSASLARIKATLKGVEKGSLNLSPKHACILMREMQAIRGNGDTLTDIEREVLALIVEGLSNPAIAEELNTTKEAVGATAWRVYGKMGIKTGGGAGTARVKAAVQAVREEWV